MDDFDSPANSVNGENVEIGLNNQKAVLKSFESQIKQIPFHSKSSKKNKRQMTPKSIRQKISTLGIQNDEDLRAVDLMLGCIDKSTLTFPSRAKSCIKQ